MYMQTHEAVSGVWFVRLHRGGGSRKLGGRSATRARPPARVRVLTGPLTHVCTCPKATPKAAWSCRSGDPRPQEQTDDATPLSCCWEHAGSQGRGKWVAFFHQRSPPPHPSSWKPGPGASMLDTRGGVGGASASSCVCFAELRSLLLPNLQPPPWETWVVVYWKQPQPAVPKGGHGKLRLLVLNVVLWVFFFYPPPPKALKVLLYYYWVLPAITEGALDPSMVLSTGFSLWEASQTCRGTGCSGISCEV